MAGSERAPFDPDEEIANRRFLQLPVPRALKGRPNPNLDVVDGLFARSGNARGLEGDAIRIDRHLPALLAKIGDEQANRSEFYAVAVIDVAPRQDAQFVGETGGKSCAGVEKVMELLAFTRSQVGGKRSRTAWTK